MPTTAKKRSRGTILAEMIAQMPSAHRAAVLVDAARGSGYVVPTAASKTVLEMFQASPSSEVDVIKAYYTDQLDRGGSLPVNSMSDVGYLLEAINATGRKRKPRATRAEEMQRMGDDLTGGLWED